LNRTPYDETKIFDQYELKKMYTFMKTKSEGKIKYTHIVLKTLDGREQPLDF